LTATITSQPDSGGVVSVNSDGSFDYQPADNFNGTETFEYEASDGQGGTSSAHVTVNVTPVNDAPIAEDNFVEVIHGQPPILMASVLDNDIDIDGNGLIAVLVDTPVNGSVSFSNDGQFVYTPNPDFVGVDSFTYLASDGVATSVAMVEITVSSIVGPPPTQITNPLDSITSDDPTTSSSIEPESNIGETDDSSTTPENDEDNDGGEDVIFVPPRALSPRVVDLRQTPGFEADGNLEDLVFAIADQDRARSVLKAILTSVTDTELVESRAAEELERVQSESLFTATFDAKYLFNQIDNIETSDSFLSDFNITVGAITAFGTIGYVLWALRGGALVALAMSQLPAWQMLDPLPILDGNQQNNRGDGKEDLDGFFTR